MYSTGNWLWSATRLLVITSCFSSHFSVCFSVSNGRSLLWKRDILGNNFTCNAPKKTTKLFVYPAKLRVWKTSPVSWYLIEEFTVSTGLIFLCIFAIPISPVEDILWAALSLLLNCQISESFVIASESIAHSACQTASTSGQSSDLFHSLPSKTLRENTVPHSSTSSDPLAYPIARRSPENGSYAPRSLMWYSSFTSHSHSDEAFLKRLQTPHYKVIM